MNRLTNLSSRVSPVSTPCVVFVINSIHRSGAEKQVLMLMESLSSRQRFTLVSLAPIAQEDIQLLRGWGGAATSLNIGSGFIGLLKGAWHLRKLIKKHEPCTVHAWLFRSNFLAAIATIGFPAQKIRLITSERNMPFWLRPHHKIVVRWIFARSHFVLFNSVRASNAWAPLVGGQGKMHVIPNGIDLHHLEFSDGHSITERSSTDCEGMPFVIGCVGRFAPQKRQLDVIEAAARLKDNFPAVRWYLVGDGSLRPTYEASIREHGLEELVILTGYIKDMNLFYNRMHLLVQASSSEGMPNVIMEAMARGVPVVATDVGDTAVLLDHGRCGVLVQPRNVSSLCDAVSILVNDPAKLHHFSEVGREYIRTFDRSKMVYKTTRLYREAWL